MKKLDAYDRKLMRDPRNKTLLEASKTASYLTKNANIAASPMATPDVTQLCISAFLLGVHYCEKNWGKDILDKCAKPKKKKRKK